VVVVHLLIGVRGGSDMVALDFGSHGDGCCAGPDKGFNFLVCLGSEVEECAPTKLVRQDLGQRSRHARGGKAKGEWRRGSKTLFKLTTKRRQERWDGCDGTCEPVE
jgi:hypothetical protein